MKKIACLIGALFITSCDEDDLKYYYTHNEIKCNEELIAKKAEFIIKCATAANPHSDEEGEDLVRECKNVSNELYNSLCNSELELHTSRGHHKVTLCSDINKKSKYYSICFPGKIQ